jgi:hypothetical protein
MYLSVSAVQKLSILSIRPAPTFLTLLVPQYPLAGPQPPQCASKLLKISHASSRYLCFPVTCFCHWCWYWFLSLVLV